MKRENRKMKPGGLVWSRRRPASNPNEGGLIEGRVVGLSPDGAALFVTTAGKQHLARIPQHIDVRWLAAAVAVAAVEAAIALSDAGRAVLWCLFPGPDHADVAADVEIVGERVRIAARQSVEVRCGRSSLTLEREGEVRLRGKDLLSRASHSNRIKGGIIRLN